MTIVTRAAGLSASLSALLLSLSACSPTFNWRALPLDGTPLQALMPCKPESASRPVPLLQGVPTTLHLHSCEAGGLRFAVAWADAGAADRVAPALQAWRQASLHTLRVAGGRAAGASPGTAPAAPPADTAGSATPPAADDTAWPAQVAGADAVLGVQASGTDPQGQPVQTRAVYFARGTQVFQAAVYGARLPDEALEAFFAGLRLAAP